MSSRPEFSRFSYRAYCASAFARTRSDGEVARNAYLHARSHFLCDYKWVSEFTGPGDANGILWHSPSLRALALNPFRHSVPPLWLGNVASASQPKIAFVAFTAASAILSACGSSSRQQSIVLMLCALRHETVYIVTFDKTPSYAPLNFKSGASIISSTRL